MIPTRSPAPDSAVNPSRETPLSTNAPRLVRLVSSETLGGAGASESIRRDKDGAALTASLARALELSELYEIDEIEIATPLLFSEPVVIRRDGMSITSSVGGSTIVFQNTPKTTSNRAEMISLGSNRIEFVDLAFSLGCARR